MSTTLSNSVQVNSSSSTSKPRVILGIVNEQKCFADSSLYHSLTIWVLWRVYSLLYLVDSTTVLINSLKLSSSRQCESVLSSFCNFLHVHRPLCINGLKVLFFLRFLFCHKSLAPVMVAYYKSARRGSLKLLSALLLLIRLFLDFTRTCLA